MSVHFVMHVPLLQAEKDKAEKDNKGQQCEVRYTVGMCFSNENGLRRYVVFPKQAPNTRSANESKRYTLIFNFERKRNKKYNFGAEAERSSFFFTI